MQHSEQPYVELTMAYKAIEAMREAKTLDNFEEHWKEFLRRIERVWNKASSHYGKSPRWNGWKGKTEKLRKTDPLLSYLINARGADEHTVNEIVGRESGGIGINPAEGQGLYIDFMAISRDEIRIRSPQQIRVDFIPIRIMLLPVKNRGREYPIPTTHLGKPIDPRNVISVAETGAKFYQEFLFEAEALFIKSRSGY